MRLALFLLILLSCTYLKGQHPEKYDSVFRKIYLEISTKDFNKAKGLADSLFIVSETPLYKTKSLMLSASLCQQSGEVREAIKYALKAEKYIQTTQELEWQARVYGFLATEYRFVGLFSESQKYLDKTQSITLMVKDERQKNNLFGFIYQERAYQDLEKKNYSNSIENIQKSLSYFDQERNSNYILIANNFQLLGLNYYHLNKDSLSFHYYKEALKILGDYKGSFHYGLVNNGLANLHLDKEELEKAKLYLDEAKSVSLNSNYLNLKIEVLKSFEKYYLKKRNYQKLNRIKEKKDSLILVLNKESNVYLDETFKGLSENTQVIVKSNKKKNYFILL